MEGGHVPPGVPTHGIKLTQCYIYVLWNLCVVWVHFSDNGPYAEKRF